MGQNIKQVKGKIIFKHQTAAEWDLSNDGAGAQYVPDVGERVLYDPDETHPYTREKFGDGEHIVKDLPFAGVQADWNQNDETETSFIMNKPFGETVTIDIIEPEANPVTVTDANGLVLTRISDTIVYANDIVDLTIESNYNLAEADYQSNVFTYKDVLHWGTPSNYTNVYDWEEGGIGWIYTDDNGNGNNIVLFCYAPGIMNIFCEGHNGTSFAIYEANITQPGIYYNFETFKSVEVALTSSQIKKIDSKFLPEGPVYSPNGTMLSQKLDGDGSFEFVNGAAGIWEYDPKRFTEENRVGTYSVTLGGKSAATGKRALAEGTSTWAEGNYSHAEGNKSYAKGAQSHAEGAQTYASGEQSHAEGWKTSAHGASAHAEGATSSAYGAHAHAEGTQTAAHGQASHTEGIKTQTTANYAHAEGNTTLAQGSAAHAEGGNTKALGDSSHAEGTETTASGQSSHAEGDKTIAKGNTAHAEGYYTIAGNSNESSAVCPAHAEGHHTIASAHASHAEGAHTTASGMMAHAEGEHTVASGKNSHAGGLGTRATADNQTVVGEWNAEDNEALFIVGNGIADWIDGAFTNEQRRNAFTVMADATDPTIKLGETELSETQLQDLLQGSSNIVDGLGTNSLMQKEDAGKYTDAKPNFVQPNALKGQTIIPKNEILGNYATAFGGYAAATGKRSLAEGTTTWALGDYSHAEGNNSVSEGHNSHAEGKDTWAVSINTHAEGELTTASGNNSHSEGLGTKALSKNSHAEGESTIAGIDNTDLGGNNAHAEGYGAKATGSASHAEGTDTQAKSGSSHAEGQKTIAYGESSHAEGKGTTAYSRYSHAEGEWTQAGNSADDFQSASAHAEGHKTKALNWAAHSEGNGTEARGIASHAGGSYTIATRESQTAIGEYNAIDDDALFIVGNGWQQRNEWGSSYGIDPLRKNAFVVKTSGDVHIAGSLVIGNIVLDEAKLQKIINFIDSIEG